MNIKAWIAEFIGTFALCFVGIGAIANLANAEAGLIGIALAHGLTIAVMAVPPAPLVVGSLTPP